MTEVNKFKELYLEKLEMFLPLREKEIELDNMSDKPEEELTKEEIKLYVDLVYELNDLSEKLTWLNEDKFLVDNAFDYVI
jgi:hypothetical protein